MFIRTMCSSITPWRLSRNQALKDNTIVDFMPLYLNYVHWKISKSVEKS